MVLNLFKKFIENFNTDINVAYNRNNHTFGNQYSECNKFINLNNFIINSNNCKFNNNCSNYYNNIYCDSKNIIKNCSNNKYTVNIPKNYLSNSYNYDNFVVLENNSLYKI